MDEKPERHGRPHGPGFGQISAHHTNHMAVKHCPWVQRLNSWVANSCFSAHSHRSTESMTFVRARNGLENMKSGERLHVYIHVVSCKAKWRWISWDSLGDTGSEREPVDRGGRKGKRKWFAFSFDDTAVQPQWQRASSRGWPISVMFRESGSATAQYQQTRLSAGRSQLIKKSVWHC